MAWNDLNPNNWATRQDVSDAVDDGFFTLNTGQSLPTTDMEEFVTENEAITWLDLDTSKIPTGFTSTDWLPIKYYKGSFLTISQTFEPLASPIGLGYDSGTGLLFFADRDNNTSGLWYIDPQIAQTGDDATSVNGVSTGGTSTSSNVPDNSTWPVGIVVTNGKAYVQGNYSSGCIVVNCSTKAVTKTIAYGNNGDYVRGPLTLIGSQIWATSNTQLYVLDTVNDDLLYTVNPALMPQFTDNTAAIVTEVGNNVWVLLTQGTSPSVVEVYPKTTTLFDYDADLVGNISIPETTTRGGSTYICRGPFYDSDNDYVYITGGGDNIIYVYKGATMASAGTISFPAAYTGPSIVDLYLDEHNERLYASWSKVDNSNRTVFEIDRVNLTILHTIDGAQYRQMIYVASTGYTYTADPGNVYSASYWNTDGSIKALS